MSEKKSLLKITLILAIACGSYFGYGWWMKKKAMMMAAMAANRETEVKVAAATKEEVTLTVDLAGRVNAYKISEIRPQVEGIVKKITFEEGSIVKAGKPLYEINSRIYKSAYEDAFATYAAAKSKKDRYQVLLKIEAVSKQEFEEATANEAKAKTELNRAKQNLDYSTVAAPISGYVGKSNVTEGAIVSPAASQILTTIAQLDPIYVDMALPSKNALAMGEQKGANVVAIINGEELQEKGKLKLIEVFADETTDSIRLRANFNNKSHKLIPGSFVTAKIYLKPFLAITVLQKAAMRLPNGGLAVWIMTNEGKAKMRPIKANQAFGDKWVVVEGLEEGELVIQEGFMKLKEDAPVKIQAEAPSQAQPAAAPSAAK